MHAILKRSLLLPAILLSTPAAPQADLDRWADMARRVVTAHELIGSSVTNGVTPMGMISDFVLTPDGADVQYLLFEVPYPLTLWGAQDGFVEFEDVSFERTAGLDLEVRFDEEESLRLPEEFEATRADVEYRLASYLIKQRAHFEDGEALDIENLLVDAVTGAVTHLVVETDPEAIIRSDRRAVPTENVEIREDGRVFVSLHSEALDGVQNFDPAFL